MPSFWDRVTGVYAQTLSLSGWVKRQLALAEGLGDRGRVLEAGYGPTEDRYL